MTESLSRRSFIGMAAGVAAVAGLGVMGSEAFAAEAASSKKDKAASSAKDKASSAKDAAKGGNTWTKTEVAGGSITAVGSTALQPLVEAASQQYTQTYTNVQISVQGGGSGTGLSQVSQGAVQIGNSDLFAEEKKIDPSNLTDNKVCVVGMGPVANADAGVTDIKLEDLKGIFTGAITNWKDLGGKDEAITVINRAAGSGTRATFEAAVLGGDEAVTAQEQDSSGTVAKMVTETPGAISYLAFSYYEGATFTALKVDGVEPTEANVETGDWKIWAYEHMYTAKDADAATKDFIEYMLSDKVQGELVEKLGYIPMTGMKVEKDATGKVTKL